MSATSYAPALGDKDAANASVAPRLVARYLAVRQATEALCDPLVDDDWGVQSMPDASPVKWHAAHTTWFFETFVLERCVTDYVPYCSGFKYLFNSYYEAVGPRHPRPQRGLLTRPSVAEIRAYRRHIDERVVALIEAALTPTIAGLIELGVNHEQQHQELILTDLQHAFSFNALLPVYRPAPKTAEVRDAPALAWESRPGGVYRVGHRSQEFAFDNEGPSHQVYLQPFGLALRPVTAGEFSEFIDDGGYRRPELWLSDGWTVAQTDAWQAPLYWRRDGARWSRFSLHGLISIDPAAPVCHVSFFEADAYARWRGCRLPLEHEWEIVAAADSGCGQFVDDGWLVPVHREHHATLGGAWTWTASAYLPYPGFAAASGAIGEYNGKFMSNKMVLRGGSCFTPRGHARPTYRNFFPPETRWQVSTLRLARWE